MNLRGGNAACWLVATRDSQMGGTEAAEIDVHYIMKVSCAETYLTAVVCSSLGIPFPRLPLPSAVLLDACVQALDDTDYCTVQGRRFIKKSGEMPFNRPCDIPAHPFHVPSHS